jgi:coproporphyrinogen III oxidase-like Fe-S oxidoreductase
LALRAGGGREGREEKRGGRGEEEGKGRKKEREEERKGEKEWCVKKCPYCDFNSHEQRTENDTAYIQVGV